MASRYFPNLMPDFIAETPQPPPTTAAEEEIAAPGTQESLLKLLYTPIATLSQQLKRAALDLKETVVIETWGFGRQWIQDYTPYTGVLGTAFLLLKAYQVSNNKNDLNLAAEIVKDCDTASSHSSVS